MSLGCFSGNEDDLMVQSGQNEGIDSCKKEGCKCEGGCGEDCSCKPKKDSVSFDPEGVDGKKMDKWEYQVPKEESVFNSEKNPYGFGNKPKQGGEDFESVTSGGPEPLYGLG